MRLVDVDLVVSSSDQVMLLSSGCLCCTSRGDLIETLGDLMERRGRGEVPSFVRVIVETTGLADPAPILQALMTDLMMLSNFRMGTVVAVVDGYHGSRTLDAQPEAVKQAAFADRIVLSKGDIASPKEVAELVARLHRLNPIAPVIEAVQGAVEPGVLFGGANFDVEEKTEQVRSWLTAELPRKGHQEHADHHHDPNRHDARIRAHCLRFAEPLNWETVATWLDRLAIEQGENLLRVKGLLNVSGQDEPVVIQGVHHLFHPPSTLPAWPDTDRRSRLVFIVRDLDRAAIESGAPASLEP